MFFKRTKLTTLAKFFDETILIEKDRNILITNIQNESNNSSSSRKRIEHSGKNMPEKKETGSFDMESLQRVIKKLADEVIDIKNNNNEHNQSRGYF